MMGVPARGTSGTCFYFRLVYFVFIFFFVYVLFFSFRFLFSSPDLLDFRGILKSRTGHWSVRDIDFLEFSGDQCSFFRKIFVPH